MRLRGFALAALACLAAVAAGAQSDASVARHAQAGVAYAAAMQGRKAATLAAVQQLADGREPGAAITDDDCGWDLTPQYAALLRFGLWDEMIAVQPPDARLPCLTAGYLYGRGFALAARGRFAEAQVTLADLAALGAAVPPQARAGANSLTDVVGLAKLVVAARLAASAGHNAEAAQLLTRAVAAEDALAADDPPDWFFPVRQLLGAQLLIAGDSAGAEAAFAQDLVRNPGNGWSLYGRVLALTQQGRTAEAARVRHEQQAAWHQADVVLPGSAFWYAGIDTASCECEHFLSADRQTGRKLLRAQDEAGVH
jgi:tetratricopeptide (TPR) repeat protein